ncbi:MAG: hypothetical protein IJ386_04070 [Clostridia bacterium]|nr:hypothetical protein [Clostridia bacterium]
MSNNIFYELSSNSNRYKYISETPDFIRWNECVCESCGRNNPVCEYVPSKKRRFIIEGGKKYPDHLDFCGAGNRFFIISENALSAFVKEDVSGIDVVEPVEIFVKKGDGLTEPDSNTPEYYRVTLNGLIDFDYEAMFLRKKKHCPVCGKYELNRQRLYPMYVDEKEWNGCDLCALKTFPARVICSEKIKRIVKRYKLSGFELEKIDERPNRE